MNMTCTRTYAPAQECAKGEAFTGAPQTSRKKNREKKQGPDLQMPQQQRLGTRGRQTSRGEKE